MLSEWIIALAIKTPYRKGHLHHADGSLYMARFALFETKHISARVHYIATADKGRVLHDHPWNFLSVVLCGGYMEFRPWRSAEPIWDAYGQELGEHSVRGAGSVAYRSAKCRHEITWVLPDTWTLFIYGKEKQEWGFFTREGKIGWRDYLASGNSTMSKENNNAPTTRIQ